MTFYEHAMLGGTLALALGARRRHGWPIIAMAGIAAALPDWDGLSLAFGPAAYSSVHRVWGHNLLASALVGAVAGGVGLLCHCSTSVRRRGLLLLNKLGQPSPIEQPTPPLSAHAVAVWIAVGVLAGISHLPADVIYSGSPGTPDWPLPLLWPFSPRSWSFPILVWGDFGPTLIFIAEMFALYRWQKRANLIAWLTLLAVIGYLTTRWLLEVSTS
jgi:membrane-bound metal-dependent hydrolase YbcI (DUF457 family)